MTRLIPIGAAGLRATADARGVRCAALVGCVAVIAAATATACTGKPEPALAQLTEARGLSTALLVGFTRAADAANRAVMADTDRASAEFAQEAQQAAQQVQSDATKLEPILQKLRYYDELRWLKEFDERLAKYRALDRTILELAVANTNLKAQQLAFGPAGVAATAMRDALDPVAHAEHAKDTWHVRALAMTAVAALREIQVLQAPHIAEADDDAMTRIETQMASAQAQARSALADLAGLVGPAWRPQVSAATSALDRVVALNTQIIKLSRGNTNVRSLALSLGQKRTLTAACDDSLRALHEALAGRRFSGTR